MICEACQYHFCCLKVLKGRIPESPSFTTTSEESVRSCSNPVLCIPKESTRDASPHWARAIPTPSSGINNRNDARGRLDGIRGREEKGFFDTFPMRRRSCRFGNEKMKETIVAVVDRGDETKSSSTFSPNSPKVTELGSSSGRGI